MFVHRLSFLCCVVSLCFVCLRPVSCVHNVASVSLDCPFLVAPSVFSNVYFVQYVCIWMYVITVTRELFSNLRTVICMSVLYDY